MEIQFDSIEVPCLYPVVRQAQNLEETQELRIGDGMPDIGRIIGAWGQILLRGKEWRTGQLGASCGVMVWALYIPEGGGEIQKVESWIPFQVRWDFQDPGKEGKMRTQCLLRGVDVRSTSARKLMVRVGVAVYCDAEIQGKVQIPKSHDNPDVYLLKNMYPVQMPVESGEKMFSLDEDVKLPGNLSEIEKLLRYELRPELIERKVIGNKAVFRGCAILHILYGGMDGELHSFEVEIPFSQYTELDSEYSESADISLWLSVTNLEVEPVEDGSLHLQCGLTGQYKISDRQMIEIAEDAYSTKMKIKPKLQQIRIPAILEEVQKTITYNIQPDLNGRQIIDASWYPDYPNVKNRNDEILVEFPGVLQILCYEPGGELRSEVCKVEESCSYSVGTNVDMHISVSRCGKYMDNVSKNGSELHLNAIAELSFVSNADIAAVAGAEMEEDSELSKDRPSLILCRANGSSLWNIAKAAGSSVKAITEVNQLSDEAEKGAMLLIPVLK